MCCEDNVNIFCWKDGSVGEVKVEFGLKVL